MVIIKAGDIAEGWSFWDEVKLEIKTMGVSPHNLQQLCDVMSIWTKNQKCFQHLSQYLCHEERRHLWRQKGFDSVQGVPNKMSLKCLLYKEKKKKVLLSIAVTKPHFQ